MALHCIILAHLAARYWSVYALVPLFLEKLGSPLHAGCMVARSNNGEFLDCLPHLETTMHHVVTFKVGFRARVHEPFTYLTHAASTRTCLRHSLVPPHIAMVDSTSTGIPFGSGMPSLRELLLERYLPCPIAFPCQPPR